MRASRILKLIMALSVVGMIISSYSLLHNKAFVSGAFCTLGATFNCDVVNRGPFSEFFGVPVAAIGIVGYAFLLGAAALRLKNPSDNTLLAFLLVASVGGMAFSGYLTYLEAFVLFAWCLLCLTSQAIMLTIFLSSVTLYATRPPTR